MHDFEYQIFIVKRSPPTPYTKSTGPSLNHANIYVLNDLNSATRIC